MIIDEQEKINVFNGSMVFNDRKEKVDWITDNPKTRTILV